MRFDSKGRVRSLTSVYGNSEDLRKYESELIAELGEQGYTTASTIVDGTGVFDEQDINSIKKSYLSAQKTKTISPIFVNDNYFFELFSDQDFQFLIDTQLNEGMIDQTLDIDETILNLLRGATTEKFINADGKQVMVKGTPLEQRQPELLKLVSTYVKGGYNIYPLMRKINQEYNNLNATSGGQDAESVAQQKVMCTKCQRILENMQTLSPYSSLFKTAEQLGELVEEEKELIRQNDYDNIDIVQDKIAECRTKLMTRISTGQFDMEDLIAVADGKQHYLQESEPGFNYQSSNYAMYTGMLETKKCATSILRQQNASQE